MPLNGSGTYTPPTPEYPAIPNTTILASDYNTILEDLATALSTALYKDGQATMAANLNMASHKITNLTTGTADADAVNFLQVFTDPVFTGVAGNGVTITGTKATVNVTACQIDSTGVNITGLLTLSGTTSTPNLAITDDSTSIANTHFVQQMVFNAALPLTTGATGKVLAYDGVDIKWQDAVNASVVRFADGTDATKKLALVLSGITTATTRSITVPDADFTLVGAALTQTLTNKTITIADNALTIQDNSDATKQWQLQLSGITTGNTRVAAVADRDITLDTPAIRWLQSLTASNSTTLDFTAFDSSLYKDYMIVISGMDLGTTNADLLLQLTIGGTLRTTNYYHHTNISNHTAATYAGLNGSNVSAITLADDLGNKPDTTNGLNMCIYLFNIDNTAKYPLVKWVGVSSMGLAGGFKEASGAGGNSNLGAITTARLLASSGNIKDGTAHLYGIRRS